MNQLCQNRQLCLGDQPGANLSSEDPDLPIFIGQSTGWDNNKPPLGGDWTSSRCFVTFESTLSQADADAQAAASQLVCLVEPPPGNQGSGTTGPGNRIRPTGPIGWHRPDGTTDYPPPNGPVPPNGPTRQLFDSQEASCVVPCPDGNTFAVKLAPGYAKGFTQNFADAVASSEACREAQDTRICFGTLTDFVCFEGDYASVLIVSGNHLPLNITLADGEFPPGLVGKQVSATSMLLSGTATKPGNYTFTLQALDAAGTPVKHEFTITVLGLADDTDIDYPDGEVGDDYIWDFKAAGGKTPYTFFGSDFPHGLVLAEDGVLAGVPSEYGTYAMNVGVRDAVGHECVDYRMPITINPAPITAQWCAWADVGWSMDLEQRTFRDGDNSWELQDPPDGISMEVAEDTDSALVKASKTLQPGSYPIVVSVADSSLDPSDTAPPNFMAWFINLFILGFTHPLTVPDAHLCKTYNHTITATGATQGRYSYGLFSGTLPPGLTLHSTGVIDGTASGSATTYNAIIYVEDIDTGFRCYDTLSITTVGDYLDWADMVWAAPIITLSGQPGAAADSNGSGSSCSSEATSGAPTPQTPPPITVHSGAFQSGLVQFPCGKNTPCTVMVEILNAGDNTSWSVQVFQNGFQILILSNTGAASGAFTATPGHNYTVEVRTDATATADFVGGFYYYTSTNVQISAFLDAPPN